MTWNIAPLFMSAKRAVKQHMWMDGYWEDILCLSSPTSPPSYFVFQLLLKAPVSAFVLFELPQMQLQPADTELQILQS